MPVTQIHVRAEPLFKQAAATTATARGTNLSAVVTQALKRFIAGLDLDSALAEVQATINAQLAKWEDGHPTDRPDFTYCEGWKAGATALAEVLERLAKTDPTTEGLMQP